MPSPSTAIARAEFGLTFSEFLLQADRLGFIAPRALRPRLVGQEAADFAVVPVAQLLMPRTTLRAPKAGYAQSDFTFDKLAYQCEEHGAEEPIDDREVGKYRDLLDCESIHAQRAADAVLRNFEIEAADAVFDEAVWTGESLTTDVDNGWNDPSAATPIADVAAAREKLRDGCGLMPNCLILSDRTFRAVRECEEIVERVRYTGSPDRPAIVSRAALAQVLDVDEILVGSGVRNVAAEGQSPVLTSIWPDGFALLARRAVGMDPTEPSFARCFVWSGDGIGAPGSEEELAVIVEEYRREEVRGSVVRARSNWAIKVLLPAAAHLLTGLLPSDE